MSPFIIVGNWKMNPRTSKNAEALFRKTSVLLKTIKKTRVIACAPAPFLGQLSKIKGKMLLGAQDVSVFLEGSYTGSSSASMISSVGATYVIIGHSEKRKEGDTNEMVAQKIDQALKAKLLPIVCVGEKVRDDKGEYHNEIKTQLEISLSSYPKSKVSSLVIAYEPVWAIGKNATREATPEESREMSVYIKKVLNDMWGKNAQSITVLYGGSVNAENAPSFLRDGGVQGLLVGRESLNPSKFARIITTAEKIINS